MYAAAMYLKNAILHHHFHLFLLFVTYVWWIWFVKLLFAMLYHPYARVPYIVNPAGGTVETGKKRLKTTVISPVYNEDPDVFHQVLRSVRDCSVDQLIVVVDGGAPKMAEIARCYADVVVCIPKKGKRHGIAAGMNVCAPEADAILVLDSDTVWEPDMVNQLLIPFEVDPRIGGVTPRQAIFKRNQNAVRRLADWIEDMRYSLTVPAQSWWGQVGCLAGRTIAYRRQAFEEALPGLLFQSFFGVQFSIGDDRVLTNELLKKNWKTVYQSTALCTTDAPNEWQRFFRQQLRWGRSSQRETLLTTFWDPWLWRKPAAFFVFWTDVCTPFFLLAVVINSIVSGLYGGVQREDVFELKLPFIVLASYAGMITSIMVRQIYHLLRQPSDIFFMPIFVLQLTLLMSPIRIMAFFTMFANGWMTRSGKQNPVTDFIFNILGLPFRLMDIFCKLLNRSVSWCFRIPLDGDEAKDAESGANVFNDPEWLFKAGRTDNPAPVVGEEVEMKCGADLLKTIVWRPDASTEERYLGVDYKTGLTRHPSFPATPAKNLNSNMNALERMESLGLSPRRRRVSVPGYKDL